ncbi:hypothetical protein [Azospirillum sp. SYSU D00513]|uniref:hypothetical protein n=1 Tax=Azospirillum sp. SYSU D00513 TaxID=2812561 RepID=UPI001A9645E9|nr:hypothetical protein [Azospirillum sp. SYSU D00513]
MTNQLHPATRESAYGNARALCNDLDAENIYPAFDVAMDMACRLNELVLRAPSRPSLDRDVPARREESPVEARAARRTAQ